MIVRPGWPRLLISLASPRMGAPSFAFFAKGGTRKCLRIWVNSVATNPYSTGIIDAHPCKKRKDGAPSVEMVQCKGGPPASDNFLEHLISRRGSDFPVSRSLNRKRRIAFYHLLLEIRTFVLAPEPCSVPNPIENRSAIRLVLANDGTRQADEVRL
jgi:hypothetical protein